MAYRNMMPGGGKELSLQVLVIFSTTAQTAHGLLGTPPNMVYSNMREFIVYQDDDGTWVAEAQELPGMRMRGKTQKEALEKIQAVLRIYYPCKCED